MLPGKIASQAGHAYLGAFLVAQATPQGQEYSKLSPGTKVCLQGNLKELGRAVEELSRLNVPHYVVVDSGCEDFFGGQPTITAVGFGPARKDQVETITRRLKLL